MNFNIHGLSVSLVGTAAAATANAAVSKILLLQPLVHLLAEGCVHKDLGGNMDSFLVHPKLAHALNSIFPGIRFCVITSLFFL